VRSSPDLRRLRLALAALVASFALATLPARADETCITCHATQPNARLHDPVERLRGSVHAHAIGCSDCHGGRGTEPTVQAHDVNAGFVPRPDPATVAERCGTCHADARFIRRFREDLPTDQLALYFGDAHGRAMTAGNVSAPTCLNCHGSHDVRSPADPASTVARRHIHETCAGCHSDPAHMAGTNLPTNQEALWERSVHGVALLQHSNPRAPTCVGCHGAHGEYRESGGPEARCRHCHEDEAAAFDRSPHAAVYRRLGFSGCVACHGNHDVREATGTLGTAGGMGVCRQCHGEGRNSYDVARRIAGHAEQARHDLDAARTAAHDLEDQGLRVPAVAGLIEEATHAEIRLRVALHALDENVARDAAAAVRGPALRATQIATDARTQQSRGRRAWLLAIPLLALFIVLATMKIRSLDRDRSA